MLEITVQDSRLKFLDMEWSGGLGKDRNPLRARRRGFKWVQDVGMDWEGTGVWV